LRTHAGRERVLTRLSLLATIFGYFLGWMALEGA
jgi:hypothetical protein